MKEQESKMILVSVAVFALACYKWGDWRNWREYYPTVLFLIIGDMAYNFIFHDHSLWCYTGFFCHTICNLVVMFFVYPSAVILFLTHWPKKWFHLTLYLLAWSAGCTFVEYIGLRLNMFMHDNGWNIFWSFFMYIAGFLLVRLHYRHPLLAWPIGAVFAVATMFYFGLLFCMLK